MSLDPTDPQHEQARLRQLHALEILVTLEEQAYDDLTRMASDRLGVPVALITLIDRDRQWFKSRVGTQVTETPLEVAFCTHAMHQPDRVMVVPDLAADERFAHNPLVTGEPRVRFYAGAPLVMSDGHALGTLCALDTQPRQPTAEQLDELAFLARQVVALLEARREALAQRPPPTSSSAPVT
jgi:GAF domain-containing protein